MNRLIISLCFCLLANLLAAQNNLSLDKLSDEHPRYLTAKSNLRDVQRMIEKEAWASDVFQQLKVRTDRYVDKGTDWLSSRLQMFWKTCPTDVYIKGEYFDHAGGEKAPAPTVMLSGARSHATNYVRPKLEELQPYQEDPRGLWLRNKMLEGQPYEWATISKTGNIIQSINNEIVGIARDAAFLWWITGETKYAVVASMVFDTYMTGIYYRNVPKDLNHGHQQTLIGMSSFEVIHEDVINALVPLYDFLYDYLKTNKSDKMDIYAQAFKKWADNIIDNGVPHNNWNLMQARFILNIGLVLEDNACYDDKKGREYYIDYVLNQSSIRQWSLKQLAEYGYDANTGVWAECAGYSQVVMNDYTDMVSIFDRNFGLDLMKEIPVIEKAAKTNFQYLFPDRMYIGFGDTHPGTLNSIIYRRLVANAQLHGKKKQEREFTALLKLLDPNADKPAEAKKPSVSVASFFSERPIEVDAKIKAADINDYVTPTFHAPNASWLVQRNGMDKQHSLMIALNGSEGNHMHANGINMELYGKGYRLAPDAGIGLTLYSGLDYLEWYSQFPSHNTVCVDGISSYPVMKSNHPFKLLSCYPEPGKQVPYSSVTYSNMYFREPESQADQTRLMSIITTGEKTGYYVDVFRSKKAEGGDKMHDYFYHNMGQLMKLTASDGSELDLQPTEELSFAGAHLYAYSYIYDKKSAETSKDIKATYTIDVQQGDDVHMHMWMKGEKNRKVFSALSPMTEGLSRLKDMPYNIKEQPTLTFIARQYGEAWNRPFVAVYEPATDGEPGTITSVSYPEVQSSSSSAVAIRVSHKDGREDVILSSDKADEICQSEDMKAKATYAIWSSKDDNTLMIFMGNGTKLETPSLSLICDSPADVLLENKEGNWWYTSSQTCTLVMDGKNIKLLPTEKPLKFEGM